jgi:hypothetical protein
MTHRRDLIAAATATAAAVLLCGCSARGTHDPLPTASARPSPSVTGTVVATPTEAPSSATPVSSPTASSSPTLAAGTGRNGAHGCGDPRGSIPSGATTATIGDVDRDGRADTEFITAHPLEYGIRTAAGGLYTISDLPTGTNGTSGWSATGFDGPTFPLTVIDDGQEADLYAFVGCRLVRTLTSGGSPFVFRLGASSAPGTGTGVACTDENGGQLLARAEAVQRTDGRYDVRWTVVQFTDEKGRHADYETAPDTRYSGLHPEDPPVLAANRSTCLDHPIVHIAGR